MKKLVVILTRGGFINLLQPCEFVRIAASNNTQVSVLFRDESVAKMSLSKAKEIGFSEGYRGREAKMKELLAGEKRDDLPMGRAVGFIYLRASGAQVLDELEAEAALPHPGLAHDADDLAVTARGPLKRRLQRSHLIRAADETEEASRARQVKPCA